LAVGDVNGDGKPDVVLGVFCGFSPECSEGEFAVMLGNGDGTFQSPVIYDSGGEFTEFITLADVNKDGILDVLTVNQCLPLNSCAAGHSEAVGIALGKGDGTFRSPISYGVGSGFVFSLAVGDVDDDSNPDLIVGTSISQIFDGGIVVLKGNGDGTFTQAGVFPTGGQNPEFVAVGDANHDGRPDVFVSHRGNVTTARVGVLINVGNGQFTSPATYDSPMGFIPGLALGDVNRDSNLDIGIGVAVLLGNGDGSFQAPILTASQAGGLADVNGDGILDGIAFQGTAALGVSRGNGNGTFEPLLTYSSNSKAPRALIVADVNTDGIPDLIYASHELHVSGPTSGLVGVRLGKPVTTRIKVSSSQNPSVVGQPVTFTATPLTYPPVPDGDSVELYIGSTLIGTRSTAHGAVGITLSSLPVGRRCVKARYIGQGIHRSSGFNSVCQTVTSASLTGN